MSATTPHTPAAADALQDAYDPPVMTDPGSTAYDTEEPTRCDAKNFGKPTCDEILALLKGRVSSMAYRQTYACLAGLAVNDPVRISANATVVLALATTLANSKVFAFCRYKPTSTTCYVDHFIVVTGLSGLTAGGDVFLTDAGGYSATAGTVAKKVGIAYNTTVAILFASANTSSPSIALDTVAAKTANYSLLSTDHGSTFNNTGASGSITFTLPTALSGLRYIINRTAAQTVIVSGGTIKFGDSSGTSWTLDDLGHVELQCNGTNWIVISNSGLKTLA